MLGTILGILYTIGVITAMTTMGYELVIKGGRSKLDYSQMLCNPLGLGLQ